MSLLARIHPELAKPPVPAPPAPKAAPMPEWRRRALAGAGFGKVLS